MKTIECPDCAADIPVGDKQIIDCEKCGSSFSPRIQVYIKPHEFRNPIMYAKAHLKAATELLNSVA